MTTASAPLMAAMNAMAQLEPVTEDERSKAMVDGIARWLNAAGYGSAIRQARRQNFDSFPGDRLGKSQGLRNQLRKMLGAKSAMADVESLPI